MATTQSILITISQTWTVPTGVTAVWISAIGGGGGGAGGDGGSSGRGAGGNGEFCRNRLIAVSGSLSITIGSGGLGALSPNNGGDGSDTIIVGAFRMAGGWGGTFNVGDGIHRSNIGSFGGGMGGGPWRSTSTSVLGGAGWGGQTDATGLYGLQTSPKSWGGCGGGGGGNLGIGGTTEGPGSGCEGWQGGTGGLNVNPPYVGSGGTGGAASIFGVGPNGRQAVSNGLSAAASSYGAGGAGGSGGSPATKGGDGMSGAVLITWVA